MSLDFKYQRVHPAAQKPTKAHEADCCFDLYAVEAQVIPIGHVAKINTGIKLEVPSGWECQVRPRSGNAFKGLWVHFGTIDAHYPEIVWAIVINLSGKPWIVSEGDKICQIKFERVEYCTLVEGVIESQEGKRQSGLGSSGK